MSLTNEMEKIKKELASDNVGGLSHARNIISKAQEEDEEKSLNDEQKIGLTEIACFYWDNYLNRMEAIVDGAETEFSERAELLNSYYNFLHDETKKYDALFSSQSKFRSTILEEFVYLLFINRIKNYEAKGVLCGPMDAYANIYFTANSFKDFIKNPKIGINTKNQDFAIYKRIKISAKDDKDNKINIAYKTGNKEEILEEMEICIPIVAVECKTYLDKTMLDSVIASAEKLKSGFPHAKFYVICEWYNVADEVDPSYSQIDQIFVLRKSKKPAKPADVRKKINQMPIDGDLIKDFVKEVEKHLENAWLDSQGFKNGKIF